MVISLFSSPSYRGLSSCLIATLLPLLAESDHSPHSILLVDATSVGGLGDWIRQLPISMPIRAVTILRGGKRSLEHLLEQAAARYPIVLIATDEPRSAAAKSALVYAHAALIPVAWRMPMVSMPVWLANVIGKARLFNPRLRILLLPVCDALCAPPYTAALPAPRPGSTLLEPLATRRSPCDVELNVQDWGDSESAYFERLRDALLNNVRNESARHEETIADGGFRQQVTRLRRVALQFLA